MGAILRMPKKLWMVRNSSAQPLPDAGNYHFPTGGGQFAGFSRSFLFQHSSEQKSQGSKQAHQPCQVVLKGIPWISSPHSEQKKRKRSSGISSDRVNSPGEEARSGTAGQANAIEAINEHAAAACIGIMHHLHVIFTMTQRLQCRLLCGGASAHNRVLVDLQHRL